MPTKLSIKMGHIEFQYEGEASFQIDDIKGLFSHLESMMVAAPAAAFENGPDLTAAAKTLDEELTDDVSNLSVSSIAARLGVKSASDLAIATAAQLQICRGRSAFTRKELLEGTKSATGHYNENMSSNLSKIIQSLVSGKRLNSLSNDQMSLSASEQSSLRTKITNS